MNALKTLSLLATLAPLTACDVDDLADGGMEVGAEADAEVAAEPLRYTWLLVVDTSLEENAFGAPGADICGVSFDCGDVQGHGVDALLWAGDGQHCREGGEVNGEPCMADRDDPGAVMGVPHDPCEADSTPSHYVALGVGGVLAVRLEAEGGEIAERGLGGCSITVHERVSRDNESYQVSVCADSGGVDCLQPAPLADATEGGEVRLVVPVVD